MEELKNLSSGISDSAIESGINEIDKIYGEKRNDLAIKREEVAEKVEQQYTPTIGTESDEKKLDVKKTVTIDGTNYNVEGQLAEVKNIDSSIGDVGSDSSGYNSAKVVPVGLSVLSDDSQIPRDITPRTDGGRKTRKSKKVKKSNSRKKARKNPRKKSRKNLRRRSRRV